MIFTYFQGGLGNQMFQISAAKSIAIDNNTEAIFNLDHHDLPKQGRKCENYLDSIFRNIEFSKDYKIIRVYREPSYSYQKIPYIPGACLVGYFQSEKYFIHNKQSIKDLFSIDEKSEKIINDKYSEILSKNPVSVHVRRGDYLEDKDYHPVCSREYYDKAFSMFSENTSYLLFSDDIGWCKENFIGENFYFAEDNEDYIDLFLMSMCSHNIIANSSFSWWAAWLNNNEDKKIIAPKKWFGKSSSNNTKDLVPEEWERI